MAAAMPPAPSFAWDEPECLIENTAKGLEINQKTLARLMEVTVPVVSVSIVGMYRTGKSYLMNILAGKEIGRKGFDLGYTIQSKTKGIWVWVRPHPRRHDRCLVLLDTEGLGDVEKGDINHDHKLFTLAVLLSSTLIYNTMTTIDSYSMDKLYFVTELTKHVKVKSKTREENDEDFGKLFPTFIWAVRDFTLALEHDGQKITADGYLEKALIHKEGQDRYAQDRNRTRNCIKKYFPKRSCFTFPRPVDDEAQLQSLGTLSTRDIKPAFLECSRKFTKFVHAEAKDLWVGGTATGNVLAQLAVQYVTTIQNGGIPCIQNAVETTARIENETAIETAMQLYRSSMIDQVIGLFPTDTQKQLFDIHHECEKAAGKKFLDMSFHDDGQEYHNKLMEKVKDEYCEFTRQNVEASRELCQDIIQELLAPILQASQAGKYAVPGGYQLYLDDMKQLEAYYKDSPARGVRRQGVLREFLDSQEVRRHEILATDTKLDEQEKKLEEVKQEAEYQNRMRQASEERQRRKLQEEKDRRKSAEEHIRQLKQKEQEEIAKAQEKGFFQHVGTGLDEVCTGVVKGVKSFGRGVKSVFTSIFN